MSRLTPCRGTALLPNDSIKAKFDKPFELAYVVTLSEHQLSTDLHVKNSGTSGAATLEFQALLHNYIRAPANDVLVTPLQGVTYYDKTEATDELKAQPKTETRPGVDVKKFTDSVYENAGGKYQVVWPGGGLELKTKGFKDVVVWNPQAEAGAKIGDMEAGGWCVSSLYLAQNNELTFCLGRSTSVLSLASFGASSRLPEERPGSVSKSSPQLIAPFSLPRYERGPG